MAPQPQNKIRFDPTINLGHIITFLGIIGLGVAGWYDLSKRVSGLEDARVMQKEIYATRERVVDAQLSGHETDIRDLRQTISRITEARK